MAILPFLMSVEAPKMELVMLAWAAKWESLEPCLPCPYSFGISLSSDSSFL